VVDDSDANIWAELRGQRDILVELRTLMSGQVEFRSETKARLDRLEERRFPWPVMSGIVALISLVIAAIAALPLLGK
jgi:hypothetical protein